MYYGAMSKGCQRCRQRKVKCDQRKPACLRCEKAKFVCPGFRDLSDVIFRNETGRVIRLARASQAESRFGWQVAISHQPSLFTTTQLSPPPINEVGAGFFFSNLTCDEPPFSKSYHAWLVGLYYNSCPNPALRDAIEAAGMAAMSNKFYEPAVASKSKELYGKALSATRHTLGDSGLSLTDSTLLTVIILGLFEVSYPTLESLH
ncbi:hypothetical protein BDV95DRAFT_166335 [Massariosphaeria phaeospora]|uniref:Zn(2)-C6 fungal-type domain-containing protein n=1 Tax=Massariosphaeria phaeospora TaxID=100035 RepID=A0A7C8MIJ3_9PLEO|nr:hypothetical protein BDV95DRAFT_166335 [Massariosphaeria phaeospora]